MSEVVIAGIGQVPVGEHWQLSLRTLATRAIRAALKERHHGLTVSLRIGSSAADRPATSAPSAPPSWASAPR